MDIEKVIEEMRYGINLMLRDGENMDAVGDEGIGLSGNEARALLTEIDYWRARCGKAENMPMSPGDDTGYDEWKAALEGEADKARYLETVKTKTVE